MIHVIVGDKHRGSYVAVEQPSGRTFDSYGRLESPRTSKVD